MGCASASALLHGFMPHDSAACRLPPDCPNVLRMQAKIIYIMVRAADWRSAELHGQYDGSANDKADGFLHFSTAGQLPGSAAKHRRGETDLMLVTVEAPRLGAALKWEPARGGQLFPHLYAPLQLSLVDSVVPLPLGPDGLHLFPPLDTRSAGES